MRKGSMWKKSFQNYYTIELLTIQLHYFSVFPTLASGASIARGRPRTRGQKPKPTIRIVWVCIRLPPGGFSKFMLTKNTTKDNSLVVFVFSPLKMHSRRKALFCGKNLIQIWVYLWDTHPFYASNTPMGTGPHGGFLYATHYQFSWHIYVF